MEIWPTTPREGNIKMIWQDVVMTIGQFIFALALIPTIIANRPPTKGTCLITAIVATFYIPTLLSLGLKVSFLATILVATGWWILFFQSYRQELQKKQE